MNSNAVEFAAKDGSESLHGGDVELGLLLGARIVICVGVDVIGEKFAAWTAILDGIPIKSLKRIIDERLEELSNQATRGDLTDSKKAFFTGRFGALANKQCNLDPVSSRCFKP